MSRLTLSPALTALSAALALGLAGCESGPTGPGTLQASVAGTQALGAVVLEVTGSGIVGFTGQGDTQAYGALVTEATGVHRVVLVDRAGGRIQFGIRVEDLGADRPVVTVLNAASPENLTVPTTDIEVTIEG